MKEQINKSVEWCFPISLFFPFSVSHVQGSVPVRQNDRNLGNIKIKENINIKIKVL